MQRRLARVKSALTKGRAGAMTGTRKVAIALLGLVLLLMWLAIVANAQPTVPIPY